MMRVDKRVEKVNDRVSDVITRFENYINEKTKVIAPKTPA
jgi:hypothetical protein